MYNLLNDDVNAIGLLEAFLFILEQVVMHSIWLVHRYLALTAWMALATSTVFSMESKDEARYGWKFYIFCCGVSQSVTTWISPSRHLTSPPPPLSLVLLLKVTTLVNSSNKGPSNKKKGRSKKAHVLAASVETATLNFLDKGEKIAKESQFLKDELTAAVEDVRKQGTV